MPHPPGLTRERPPPLAEDRAAWAQARALAAAALAGAARGVEEPAPAALAVAAAAMRAGTEDAAALAQSVRRALVCHPAGSEPAVRCLRVLARAGEPVDAHRLATVLVGDGRVPRIALAALAEAAAGGGRALAALVAALGGPLRADAALLLSHLCTEPALDALSGVLRAPGPTGVHAAAALLSAEDDPFAFEVLCERLCDPREALAAARALLGAAAGGSRLRAAAGALARWAGRGVTAAESGRQVAALLLTAEGLDADWGSAWAALASEDPERTLVGAEAAWQLGDAARARLAAKGLLRRGPVAAAGAFRLLVRWADAGDEGSAAIVRGLLAHRPPELGRGAVLDALAAAGKPALHGVVREALLGAEPAAALEAARAIARLHDPPSLVPPVWL